MYSVGKNVQKNGAKKIRFNKIAEEQPPALHIVALSHHDSKMTKNLKENTSKPMTISVTQSTSGMQMWRWFPASFVIPQKQPATYFFQKKKNKIK